MVVASPTLHAVVVCSFDLEIIANRLDGYWHPMKRKPTPAQEVSLQKLFYGNHIDREQVISSHRPEMQAALRQLVKTNVNTDNLFGILFRDLLRAHKEMQQNPDDQFWRRTTIRAFAATVDGIIFCLKQTALVAGEVADYQFTDYERFFLTEEKGDGTKKFRLPPFVENAKETFKLFAKVHGVSCPVDFGSSGFRAFCQTYELRHRLIHPKSYMTFCVTDEERDGSRNAAAWLQREIYKLIDACSAGIDQKFGSHH